jgi:hypothetical protein
MVESRNSMRKGSLRNVKLIVCVSAALLHISVFTLMLLPLYCNAQSSSDSITSNDVIRLREARDYYLERTPKDHTSLSTKEKGKVTSGLPIRIPVLFQ